MGKNRQGGLAQAGDIRGGPAVIRAVLFDFDGTLTRPEAIDFGVIRRLLGCPPQTFILEFIQALPTEDERREALRILDEFELAAARASVPNDGAEELIGLLSRKGVPRGILSRNSRTSILEAMKNFPTCGTADFDVILTRESPGRHKPHPDGVLHAARLFGVAPGEVLMVGDYVFDIEAGKAAGASTALLTNGRAAPPIQPAPDFTVATLRELPPLLGL
jgi:HAD superfamily hydrolase (TIGR01509 family)